MICTRKRLARPPIVGDVVIVPLGEDWNLAIECEHVSIKQIVFVVAAELGQRLGGLGLLFGHDVSPDFAIGHLLLGYNRDIGIDVVAAVDKKIRPMAQHRGIGAHPAAALVDAPALSGGIARPDEGDGSPVRRRRAEMPDHGLADNGRRGKVREPDAIKDVLPGGKMLEQHVRGEVDLRQSVDVACVLHPLEACRGRPFDQHARWTISARPDDAGIGRHVAGLHAVRHHGAVGCTAQIGLGHGAQRRRSRLYSQRSADGSAAACQAFELEPGG